MVLAYSWPALKGDGEIEGTQLRQIADAGHASLASRDVPVGALLFYGDSVIGTGHNTVKRDGNAGGHAEINALSDAMAKIGLDDFNKLDRDSLRIVSTFEPCLMCRGALLEYRIKHVAFLKAKPVTHWLREDLRTLLYQWRREEAGEERVQDSLFEMYYEGR
jgi:tRNA(Arg) A34 adenosine deaminase TadA